MIPAERRERLATKFTGRRVALAALLLLAFAAFHVFRKGFDRSLWVGLAAAAAVLVAFYLVGLTLRRNP